MAACYGPCLFNAVIITSDCLSARKNRLVLKMFSSCSFCRPWEAPEKVLQDAGVELGVTYPYPIISQEESQKTLEYAAKIIQKTLLENPNSKVNASFLICRFPRAFQTGLVCHAGMIKACYSVSS